MARYTITIIKSNGDTRTIEQDLTPNLTQLQEGVGGGLIELVPSFATFEGRSCVAFCDEEGKIKNLPVNTLATAAWHTSRESLGYRTPLEDCLCGDILIVSGSKPALAAL